MGQGEVIEVLERMKGKQLTNREIAKKIGVNYTTSSQSIKKLLKYEEIKVVYKKEGKHVKAFYFI